jgi:hypothetical protein
MRGIVARIGIVAFSAAALMAQAAAPAAPQTAAIFQGKAAEDYLTNARIVSTKPIGEGVTRPFYVTLDLNGVPGAGIFKSIDERKSGATT